jgi:hypothetical protein
MDPLIDQLFPEDLRLTRNRNVEINLSLLLKIGSDSSIFAQTYDSTHLMFAKRSLLVKLLNNFCLC